MKYIITTFSCLVATTILLAQKIEQGLDINFKPVSSGLYYYASVTEKKEDLWNRQVYYVQEKSMAMTGLSKDKDCKIAEGKIECITRIKIQNQRSIIRMAKKM